jgi:hypothetical protein
VLVGVAEAGCDHANEYLFGLGIVELDILDLPLLVDTPQDCGSRFHDSSFLDW